MVLFFCLLLINNLEQFKLLQSYSFFSKQLELQAGHAGNSQKLLKGQSLVSLLCLTLTSSCWSFIMCWGYCFNGKIPLPGWEISVVQLWLPGTTSLIPLAPLRDISRKDIPLPVNPPLVLRLFSAHAPFALPNFEVFFPLFSLTFLPFWSPSSTRLTILHQQRWPYLGWRERR